MVDAIWLLLAGLKSRAGTAEAANYRKDEALRNCLHNSPLDPFERAEAIKAAPMPGSFTSELERLRGEGEKERNEHCVEIAELVHQLVALV